MILVTIEIDKRTTKHTGYAHEKYAKLHFSPPNILNFNCSISFFQGSTKCRARVITRMFADGEKVINRSFIHNHTPKAGLLQTGLQQV